MLKIPSFIISLLDEELPLSHSLRICLLTKIPFIFFHQRMSLFPRRSRRVLLPDLRLTVQSSVSFSTFVGRAPSPGLTQSQASGQVLLRGRRPGRLVPLRGKGPPARGGREHPWACASGGGGAFPWPWVSLRE